MYIIVTIWINNSKMFNFSFLDCVKSSFYLTHRHGSWGALWYMMCVQMSFNENDDNIYVRHNTYNSYLRCWDEGKERKKKVIKCVEEWFFFIKKKVRFVLTTLSQFEVWLNNKKKKKMNILTLLFITRIWKYFILFSNIFAGFFRVIHVFLTSKCLHKHFLFLSLFVKRFYMFVSCCSHVLKWLNKNRSL